MGAEARYEHHSGCLTSKSLVQAGEGWKLSRELRSGGRPWSEGLEKGKRKSKVIGAALGLWKPLTYPLSLGPGSPCHFCAHPRCRLPPTFDQGRRAGFGAAGCRVPPGAGAAGRPPRLCPSARRGERSWWPAVSGILGNKAHQRL